MQNLMCAQRSITHKPTNYREYHHKCLLHNDISQSLYTNIAEIKDNSRMEAPSHRHVNWLTTSLEILREVLIVVITHAICYPSGIFIQIKKINKCKYTSYLTSITGGS